MEAPTKSICFLFFLLILVLAAPNNGVEGAAGECAKYYTNEQLYKLYPCAIPAQDKNAKVPSKCCNKLKKIPFSCLCAIILSDSAKNLGLRIEAVVTIPKRCNISKRYKLTVTSVELIRCLED